MFAYIVNGSDYQSCGIVFLYCFKQPGKTKDLYGDWVERKSITKEDLMKRPGSRLVQASFVKGQKDSDDMFEHLTVTLGLTPAYISPVRPNTNMSEKNPFYTVIFELEPR